MLRAMKVLGIGLINAFALPTVIGKRAPFPTPGKTGGLHRAQPGQRQSGRDKKIKLGVGKRGRGLTSAISSSKGPGRSADGARHGPGPMGPEKAAHVGVARRRPQAVGPILAHVLGQPRLDDILPPCVRTLQRRALRTANTTP